jgi:hypothetical protein
MNSGHESLESTEQRIVAEFFRLLASWDAAGTEALGASCARRRHPGHQECQGGAGDAARGAEADSGRGPA